MSYDKRMELVQDLTAYTEDADELEALESAIDAMAFLKLLHQSLVENGAQLAEDPDTDEVGTTIDHIFGELSAACLFLSETSFARVPDMLRKIADALDSQNEPWTDPHGETAPPVPAVVIRGFRHFAQRLEATRVQKQRAINALKKVGV